MAAVTRSTISPLDMRRNDEFTLDKSSSVMGTGAGRSDLIFNKDGIFDMTTGNRIGNTPHFDLRNVKLQEVNSPLGEARQGVSVFSNPQNMKSENFALALLALVIIGGALIVALRK